MEISLKQAIILQTIAKRPGITGPELSAALKEIVPLANMPQHLARLKKREWIRTAKIAGSRSMVNTLRLTAKGEGELKHVRKIASMLKD